METKIQKSPTFVAEIDVADYPGESQVIFEATTRSALPVTDIAQIVDAFVLGANAGMFSKEPTARTKAIEVISTESQEHGRIRYVWRAAGIQIVAYHVLLNMLEARQSTSVLLDSVRLVSTGDRGTRINKNDLRSATFSRNTERLPFAVRYLVNLEDCREPLVRLEFQRAISDDESAKISTIFLLWVNVVIRGGFLEAIEDRDPDLDIEAALSSQEIYVAAPDTIELLFFDFVGQKAAFDALLNMAIRLHHLFCPLVSFEIE
jgi:hypothetical protein